MNGIEFGGLLGVLGVPLLLGFGLVARLGPKRDLDALAWTGFAVLCGWLGTGLFYFAWLLLGFSVTPTIPAVVLSACGLWLLYPRFRDARKHKAGRGSPAWGPADWVFALAVLLVMASLLDDVLRSTLLPVLQGDEANLWALRSKILYTSDGFTDGFRDLMLDGDYVYHKDYPLLDPLLQTWSYAWASGITHFGNRVVIQCVPIGAVLALASSFRNLAGPLRATALLLILVAPAPFESLLREGVGDLLVASGLALAAAAVLRYRRTRDSGDLRLLGLSVAAMLWSKNEGLLYLIAGLCAALGALLLSRKRAGAPRFAGLRCLVTARPWRSLALWIPLAILLVHLGFNSVLGFESTWSKHESGNLLSLFLGQFTAHLVPVLEFFAREVLFSPAQSLFLFPLLAVLSLPLLSRDQRLVERSLSLTLLFALLGLASVFIACPIGTKGLPWLLQTAAQRVSFQLYPFAVLIFAGFLERDHLAKGDARDSRGSLSEASARSSCDVG